MRMRGRQQAERRRGQAAPKARAGSQRLIEICGGSHSRLGRTQAAPHLDDV